MEDHNQADDLSPSFPEEGSTLKVEKAKEELLVLSLEKDLTSDIVKLVTNRLNKAQKEGRLTEGTKSQLLEKYKADMGQLENQIMQKEKIVKLYELEKTQNNLIQSFNQKLEEINTEIQLVRTSLGFDQKEDINLHIAESLQQDEDRSQRKTSPEKEAEQKLETIQEDVLKIFEKIKPKAGTK